MRFVELSKIQECLSSFRQLETNRSVEKLSAGQKGVDVNNYEHEFKLGHGMCFTLDYLQNWFMILILKYELISKWESWSAWNSINEKKKGLLLVFWKLPYATGFLRTAL